MKMRVFQPVTGKSVFISSRTYSYYFASRTYSYYMDLYRVKLLSAIDSIYNEDEWRVRGVLPFKKEYLQREIMVNDTYFFNAAEFHQHKVSDISSMYYQMLLLQAEQGFLWFIEWENKGVQMINIYKCCKGEDLLLLMALSKVILSHIIIPNEGEYKISRLNDLKNKHYAFLNRQQNVLKVMKIDLTDSLYLIPKATIWSYLESFKNTGIVYNILRDFLLIPIYDSKTDKNVHFHGIPVIGEITKVVMHHIYHKLIDIRLEEKYPGITYTRFGPEVFLVQKESDSFEIKEEEMKNLLNSLDLKDYHIDWLDGRDCCYILPACNNEKGIMLDEDGDLEVWKYEDI